MIVDGTATFNGSVTIGTAGLGTPLCAATLAYQARVLADGGTITNIADVDAAYRFANQYGFLSTMKMWVSPSFGRKMSGGVLKLYDLSSNNYDVLSSATSPTIATGIQNGRDLVFLNGTTDYLYVPNVSLNIQSTIFGTFAQKDAAAVMLELGTGASYLNAISIPEDGTVAFGNSSSFARLNQSGVFVGSDLETLMVRYDASTSWITTRHNGVDVHSPMQSTLQPGNYTIPTATLNIGSRNQGSYNMMGYVGDVLILDQAAPDSIAFPIEKFLASKYAITNFGASNVFLAAGDSLTYGYGLTNPLFQNYENYISDSTYAKYNFGFTGAGIGPPGGINGHAPQMDGDYQPFAKNVLGAVMGINDLYGTTGSAEGAALATFCQARQATGWKVLVGTQPKFASCTGNSTCETNRQAYNTWIKANWRSFADGLVDLDAVISPNYTGSASAYYDSDGHWSALGNQIVGGLFNAALSQLNFNPTLRAIGASVASNSTIAVSGQTFALTGNTGVSLITIPYAGWTGTITMIPPTANAIQFFHGRDPNRK